MVSEGAYVVCWWYQPSAAAPRDPLPQTAHSHRSDTRTPSLHPGPVLPIFQFAEVGNTEIFCFRSISEKVQVHPSKFLFHLFSNVHVQIRLITLSSRRHAYLHHMKHMTSRIRMLKTVRGVAVGSEINQWTDMHTSITSST